MIDHFESYQDYFQFALAKNFFNQQTKSFYIYPKNTLEKIGGNLFTPIAKPLDALLQNIKNPLVITALTIIAIAVVTIAFYPAAIISAAGTFLPFVYHIKPWMLKFTVFISIELGILAIGIRTLGRLNNQALMQAWDNHEIIPVRMGAQVIYQ